MTKLALIGVGRWGKNILRTLEGMKGVEVVVLQKGDDVAPTSPRLRGASGVLIATPGSTHAKIALPFIKKGLPVFIEKPMTTSLEDARALERAAKKSGSSIFVGHVHLYNPAYMKLAQLVPKIGDIKLIHFEGMAPGPARDDMSVLWDWGPHGVSMMLDLVGALPQRVRAWGPHFAKASRGKARNFAHTVMAKLAFPLDVTGTMHLSWMWPEKRVKLTVIGTGGSLVFDDTQSTRKIPGSTLTYRKVTFYTRERSFQPSYSAELPLTRELAAFVRTAGGGPRPVTDAAAGAQVVRVLAACERSVAVDGKGVRC